jgi:predicted Zn-dependent protease
MRVPTLKNLLLTTIAATLTAGLVSPAQALFVSEREIERQAQNEFRNMQKGIPLSEDKNARRYVECVSFRIINQLEEPYASMNWEVELFENDAANAFAMPGGKIGVFTGIFKVADNQDSLAAVIGHEVAHVTEKHSLKRARTQSRTNLGVVIASSALGGGNVPRGAVNDVLTTGAAIGLTLPYGRKQESEADVDGLLYMAGAGFDPRASLTLWKNMSELSKGSPPEFLSTHPSDERRMDGLVKNLSPALVKYNQAIAKNGRPSCGSVAD